MKTVDDNIVLGQDFEKLKSQAKLWIRDLRDKTKRNKLLYYKKRKRGTIHLDISNIDSLSIDALFSDKTVKFRKLLHNIADETMIKDQLLSAKAVYTTARVFQEEKNIHTLFLHFGLAECIDEHSDNQGVKTPILMSPLELKPLNRYSDFELTCQGEWFINEFFVDHFKDLKDQLDSINENLKSDFSYDQAQQILNRIQVMLTQSEVAWEFHDNLAIDNFDYTKIALVKDIENNQDTLFKHPLIAAIAGDLKALEIIRQRNDEGATLVDSMHSDVVHPSNEFLILDADSSQTQVVNRAMSGSSFVVQGPPGTGKSQTIANLIATGLAKGKKILFVAEKQVAIDVVAKKLAKAGLDHLFLDIHGKLKKKEIIEKIQKAHDSYQPQNSLFSNESNAGFQQWEAYVKTRDDLIDYSHLIHDKFEEYGLSYYDAQSELLKFKKDQLTDLQFTDSIIERLTIDKYTELKGSLEEFINICKILKKGGLFNLLYTSYLKDEAQITEIRNLYQSLLGSNLLMHFDNLSSRLNLRTFDDVKSIIDFLKLYCEIVNFHNTYGNKVLDSSMNFQKLLTDLKPLDQSFIHRLIASIFNQNYKSSLNKVKKWLQTINQSCEVNQIYKKLIHISKDYESYQKKLISYGNHLNMLLVIDNKINLEQQNVIDFEARIKQLDKILPRLRVSQGNKHQFIQALQTIDSNIDTLHHIIKYNKLSSVLSRDQATKGLLTSITQGHIDINDAKPSFEYSFFKGLVSYFKFKKPQLASFNSESHSSKVVDFQKLDSKHIKHNNDKVKSVALDRFLNNKSTDSLIIEQMPLLTKQFRKKRGHFSLKQLFTKSPQALLNIAPCWMMSPLNVAEYTPAQTEFDIVIFDEASQIKPCEAISSILRGRDTIIVGDSKQLPPTSFFSTTNYDEDEEDDGGIRDYDSILDVLDGILNKPQRLNWHYRSEDSRLIAFSNFNFYDNGLTAFPSVNRDSCFEFHKIPWRQAVHISTTQFSSNSDEVDKVVELILKHSIENPQQSLGVIAFGMEHANNIEAKLDQKLQSNISNRQMQDFFNENKEENFFIRNLERVQGNERDVIILSVGYSKNHRGEVQYRFGPLAMDSGSKRLNVAITRAKQKVILTSCFSYSEMNVDKLKQGTKLLYEYLKYIETQELDTSKGNLRPLNPFEIDIKNKLEGQGLKLASQYGAGGYYIDFVVQHPQDAGKFILAIEADGASHHSQQSARDRDRIRQQHLEKLGWKFHRIWSTNWFNNPQVEIEKVMQSYQKALNSESI